MARIGKPLSTDALVLFLTAAFFVRLPVLFARADRSRWKSLFAQGYIVGVDVGIAQYEALQVNGVYRWR